MKASTMTITLFVIAACAVALFLTLGDAHGEGDGPPAHTNALAKETSPYLLQHAHNPVDWLPWGEAAFEVARKSDKPVFLSVGYSTCHWCHVMAHESFEDEAVAAVLNEHFVCIKVDREQLPDVDEQYMLATQLFTQRGGWPNSVFLTPDRRPWYAGTYYPKAQFIQLLERLAATWSSERAQVDKQADQFVTAIREASAGGLDERAALELAMVERAANWIVSIHDERHGGFGDRPKFPPHGMLRVLFAQQAIEPTDAGRAAIVHTLDAMRLGGMYDHVGGGFARYSTDAKWFLPHFEKMLYDNAQLIVNYADGWRMTNDDAYRRTIDETFAWLRREMTDERGGFYSALDADSEGEEGKYYLWRRDEIIELLGDDDGALFADVYHITADGTYYEEANPGHKPGTSIAYTGRPIAEIAKERGVDAEQLAKQLTALRAKLSDVRSKRVPPHLDDKVLVSWNGLMIEALAYAGRVFNDARYTKAAASAAAFVLDHMREPDGCLYRTWRKGKSSGDGYLDDYAYLIRGLLELHTSTGDDRWVDASRELADVMVADFYDETGGGFFFTSAEHDTLMLRSKATGGGGNMPSPNGAAAEALTRLAVACDDARYLKPAAATYVAFSGAMARRPHATEALVASLPVFLEAVSTLDPGVIADVSSRDLDADASAGAPPVMINAYLSHASLAPGDAAAIAVRLHIGDGYHVYAPQGDPKDVSPTTVVLDTNGTPIAAADARWPEPTIKRDPVLEKDIATYSGVVTVIIPIEAVAIARAGEHTISLTVHTQACDDRACLAPRQHTLKLPFAIGDTGPARHADVFETK